MRPFSKIIRIFFCSNFIMLIAFAQNKKQQTPFCRDLLKWPFATTSVWNMPIHKNAQDVPSKIIISKNGISADEDYLVLMLTAPIQSKINLKLA